MIPREHLSRWLGISDGKVSRMTRSLQDPRGLIEQHGKRSDVRYTLLERGIGYVTRRDRAELSTSMAAWSTEAVSPNHGRLLAPGTPHPHLGRQTSYTDGITWFLSELAAEARADGASELQWSVPTARSDRASWTRVSWLGIRRSRDCRASTPSSISAMFSQLPCLGVWWISRRWAMRRASAGSKASYQYAGWWVFKLSITSTIRSLSA